MDWGRFEDLAETIKSCDDLSKSRLFVDLATRSEDSNEFAWWVVSEWFECGTEGEFELGCDLMKFLCCIDHEDPEDVEFWRENFGLLSP